MGIERRSVNGLNGLLEAVLEISAHLPQGAFLWYRGLNCGNHTLLPGLMRQGRPLAEVFDRERRLITRFRQRSLPFWPAGYPQSDWEHLFAMQHFGFPTRLLDWSENLFVAAHFALHPSSLDDDGSKKPVLWIVDPVAWNRSTPVLKEYGESIHVLTTADSDLEAYRPETKIRRPKSPVMMFGTHNSGRIVAQRGTFMVWGDDTRPMEAFADELNVSLWRLEIEGTRADLAHHLNVLGFGETMVFPDLSALAAELTRIEGWRVMA